ncbi:MAG: IclR family transcriptional regulator [Actinomycetota bacterium]|nr:IclR family transcriptional regulator [Actinomycetota bacterium]
MSVENGSSKMSGAEAGAAPQNESSSAGRSYRIEALAKGLRLLSLFNHDRLALRVKDLADLSGIPMPTVFRLVATLEEEGYLERTASGMVRPGTSVLALGFAAVQGMDLVQTSEPTMRELAVASGETVNLGVLYNDQVLFVARIARRDSLIAAGIRVGSTVPAVFSSMGKVILAFMSEEELARTITAESFAGRWGPHAVRTMDELSGQLEAARSDGYLIQQEEAIPGLSSIAAPIRQVDGTVVASINVAVPSADYPRKQLVQRLLDPVLAAAGEITRRMGGTSPTY